MWLDECILSWFQFLILRIIKTGMVPKHVAIIMDGNRRYAKKQNISTAKGHLLGFYKMRETLQWCIHLGITELTVYAYSIANCGRSKEEFDNIMRLITLKMKDLLEEKDIFRKKGVCFRWIGNGSFLSKELVKLFVEAMTVTKGNNKVILNFACAYSSRDEITDAIKHMITGVKNADILVEDIDESLFDDCLHTYKSPNPDLVIRTSGETRLSDFLMWQISNSCIYFTEVLWPEFSIWTFLKAIFYYQRCYPYLQRSKNWKPIMHNRRAFKFVKKLHKEREIMIEKTRQLVD